MAVQTRESTGTAAAPPLIDGDARLFQEHFNRASFQFSHHLADHPLFELPNLLELAIGMPDGGIYYDAGDVRVNQRWDQTPRTQMSVGQLIDRIENSGAWVVIKQAQHDPRYAALLEQALGEVRRLIGAAFPMKIRRCDAQVIITSPNRVTAYHMDRDCNFLHQIRGGKVISLFDRYDREVLPETEIERFWTVDGNAAVYKEQYQARAKTFELRPGVGVHIPVNAPHWVQNDGNISVSLAVTFQFPETKLGNVYRCNYYLRKFGLTPTPPGRSKVRDVLKGWAMGGAIGTRNVLRRVRGRKQ